MRQAMEKKPTLLNGTSKSVILAKTFGPNERLLIFPQLQKIVPVSKARWYELMQLGEAPRPIKISRQKVAWLESEIIAWLELRIQERNRKASS